MNVLLELTPETPKAGEKRRYCVWEGEKHRGYVVRKGATWVAESWPCRNRRTALRKLVEANWS